MWGNESIENIKFIDNILALVKSLHYIGMIDIEIFKTGDGIYFNELNFRSSGVIYAVTKVGVNLPTLLVDILAKGISKNSCDIDYEKAFLMIEWHGTIIFMVLFQKENLKS